jgi:choice-of-anchor A domain-containing protein
MKRNVFSFNRANFLKMAAVGLFSLNTILAYGQCEAVNPLEVPGSFINGTASGDGNFNSIVFGNYSTGDGGGTAGRLAVGGNFTLNSFGGGYQVGVADGSVATSDNLIVEGSLSNIAGEIRVRGDANYGSLSGVSTAPVHNVGEGGNTVTSGLLNFTGLKSHYVTLSNTKRDIPALGTTSVVNGVVMLTGNSTVASYVFNVTLVGGELTDIKYVNIPFGSEILINILNPIVSIAPTTGSLPTVNTHRAKTLFNFPNAEQISLTSFVLEGGVLAPLANLSAQNAQIMGPVVIGGNILLANNFSFQTSCIIDPLPVTLSSFSAKSEGAVANLSWQTTLEKASDKFVVERGVTGKNWDVIGEVQAKGESASNISYSFIDKLPESGVNLYRLKMIDLDGTFAYSRIVSVGFSEGNLVQIYPNPISEKLFVSAGTKSDLKSIEILNIEGRMVLQKLYDGNEIPVTGWQPGLYIVRLIGNNGNVSTFKLMKN